eukprot:CAMPEP_0183708554 /NCGR_PEP_ID=MMETSP0737-20130205/4832_1 /TAXON_ID=385413 /ORGANISM="Thalassiosira miniscula, Strain CCMP1093" /LENGTH=515 /DNA_ID=CAMNT_0025936447 /DNA_START=214 /DNA_END=1761 /DNA_ORIENTATION=-
MAPKESPGESVDSTSATHHAPVIANEMLGTIKENDEDMDETSTTHHEPLLAKEVEAEFAAAVPTEQNAIDLRLQKKVAEIAAKTYNRASNKSNVLSRTKLADIALVKFEEFQVGKFLGKGSFSNVHEITKVVMAPTMDDVNEEGSSDEGYGVSSFENTRGTIQASNTDGGFAQQPVKAQNARQILLKHHRRSESGTYRYAVKFLKEEIRSNPQKYAIGTADLVLEGMFLASLAHPNIIKVRGLPEGGVKSLMRPSNNQGYFLIMDRLFDTLSDRIYNEWKETHRVVIRQKFGFLKNKKDKAEADKALVVRLKVAFDIAAALQFLHSKSIIYRDLKPENLGFDVRGDIKLFDLGLVKELHPREKDREGNYKLSMAGTPRYMAPEVGLYQPYNLSADVYSFSMLLWEILALEKPLKDFTYQRLKNEIFIEGERPPIRAIFNKRLRNLVDLGWSQYAPERPSIGEVYNTLKREYLKLAPDSLTEEAISHNRRRSTHVANQISGSSMSNLLRLNSDHDS